MLCRPVFCGIHLPFFKPYANILMHASVNGYGRLAQLGEHLLDVQGVGGSSPSASTILLIKTRAPVAQWIAFLIPIQKVAGSSPVGRAILSSGRSTAW